MSEIAELLERFRRGPEILAAALTGAAGSEVDFAPDGKWSVRQIMAHLADAEVVCAMRFRQVIAENEPKLQAFDQEAWADHLDYARRKPSHSLETFRRIRSENYELLAGMPEEVFARKGMHSQRGPVSLLELVRLYADHAEKHGQQMRTVRSAFKESKAKTPR
jgi:DinB superfamily